MLTLMCAVAVCACDRRDDTQAATAAIAEAREARREAAREKARAKQAENKAKAAEEQARLAAVDAARAKLAEAQARLDVAKQNLDVARATRDQERAAIPATPTRMTDEQKLAAYEAGGITGVPSVEAAEIIRKAKLEGNAWRANYEIEAEGKGYAATQEFATKITQMPTAVRDAIVNHAKREHPGDWSRIGDEITEQAEAWTTLDLWKRTTMPGLDRRTSAAAIDAAITRYPGNWKMALFVVNDEVKKLTR
jgi:multidrug efflux pump subunit AcrA (membrane-fusion protein)